MAASDEIINYTYQAAERVRFALAGYASAERNSVDAVGLLTLIDSANPGLQNAIQDIRAALQEVNRQIGLLENAASQIAAYRGSL